MSRRYLATLGLALVVGLAATPASAAVKLKIWVQSQPMFDQINWIAQRYTQEHPDVTFDVEFISASQADFTTKISLAVAAGAPPDITWLEGSTPRELAAEGLFLDVSQAMRGLRFTPADVTEMTYKGRMYAAPFYTTTRGLIKRVDKFEEAGLDPHTDPASMDELKQWHQKLTIQNADGTYSQVGMIPWGTNWGAPAWMWAFGGQLVDESGLHPTATDPNNIKAFDWLHEWAEPFGGHAPPSSFAAGTRAMEPNSTSAVGRYLDQGIEFTTGEVPHAVGGANGTWGGGQAFAIPVNAAHVPEAMKFLRYMVTPELQVDRFHEFNLWLPANWDAMQEIAHELPAVYGPMIKQFPEARARTPLWIDYYVRELRPAVTAVVTGKKTPQAALSEVQQVMTNRFAEVFGD